MKQFTQKNTQVSNQRTASLCLMIATVTSLLSACAGNSYPDPQMPVYPQSYTQNSNYDTAPQTISSEQLQSLVSPIALYPDSLL